MLPCWKVKRWSEKGISSIKCKVTWNQSMSFKCSFFSFCPPDYLFLDRGSLRLCHVGKLENGQKLISQLTCIRRVIFPSVFFCFCSPDYLLLDRGTLRVCYVKKLKDAEKKEFQTSSVMSQGIFQ